jgi:hypothetical protein
MKVHMLVQTRASSLGWSSKRRVLIMLPVVIALWLAIIWANAETLSAAALAKAA